MDYFYTVTSKTNSYNVRVKYLSTHHNPIINKLKILLRVNYNINDMNIIEP